ncbi:MAG: hypothetical protein QXZ53_06380 [Candidatus Bathyarchaeia archaeon]
MATSNFSCNLNNCNLKHIPNKKKSSNEEKIKYINFGLSNDVTAYLAFNSSLLDQEVAKWSLERKFLIENHSWNNIKEAYLAGKADSKEVLDIFLNEARSEGYERLSEEIEKIPESKELDRKNLEALEDLLYSITMSKNPVVKSNLAKILDVGIPEKRKYCSALQALLWYYVDMEKEENPLEKETSKELKSWNFLHGYFSAFSSNDLIETITGSIWIRSSVSNNFQSEKWKNYEEVMYRINDPHLISIFMIKVFRYAHFLSPTSEWTPPEKMFEIKKGNCVDHAGFATTALVRNGYKALVIGVYYKPDEGPDEGHAASVYKDKNGKLYLLDSLVFGPFKDVEDAAEFIVTHRQGEKLYGFDLFDVNRIKRNESYFKN